MRRAGQFAAVQSVKVNAVRVLDFGISVVVHELSQLNFGCCLNDFCMHCTEPYVDQLSPCERGLLIAGSLVCFLYG